MMIRLDELEGEDLKTIRREFEEQTGYKFAEAQANGLSLLTEEELKASLWDLASDLGVPDALLYYLDMERFIEDSKMDYQTLEIDGRTYYFKSW